MLQLSEVGTEEETQGHCVYCQQNTTWLITVLPGQRLRFECVRCCKISRDVYIAP
jgi:hypothetical protein